MFLKWIAGYSAAPRRTLSLLAALAVLIGGASYLAQQASEASHSGYPTIDIRPTRGGAPLTVTARFADYLLLPGATFKIDFGDGTELDNLPTYDIGSVRYVTAKHTYFRSGIYVPKLSMRRTDGSSNFYYATSHIYVQETQYLDVSASPQQGRAPLTSTITYHDYDLFPDTRVSMEFGDGTLETNPGKQDIGSVRRWSTSHAYRQAGSYQVTVRAESPSLRITKLGTKRVFATSGEALDFTTEASTTDPKTITVKLSDALIGRYCDNRRLTPCEGLRWRFSDGVLVSHGSPHYTHTFQNTGSQTITVSFADLKGERKVTIPGAGTPAPTPTSTINFDDLATGTTVSTQYLASNNVELTSSGGAPQVFANPGACGAGTPSEASSQPNFLVGNPNSTSPITLTFPKSAAVKQATFTLISVGRLGVMVQGYDLKGRRVYNQTIRNWDSAEGCQKKNNLVITNASGLSKVVLTPRGDGFGIDDVKTSDSLIPVR